MNVPFFKGMFHKTKWNVLATTKGLLHQIRDTTFLYSFIMAFTSLIRSHKSDFNSISLSLIFIKIQNAGFFLGFPPPPLTRVFANPYHHYHPSSSCVLFSSTHLPPPPPPPPNLKQSPRELSKPKYSTHPHTIIQVMVRTISVRV